MRGKQRRLLRFTLVEIMIVVAIIGILMAMAIPSFVHARNESRKRACIANLKEMDEAKSVWALENKKVTGDSVSFGDLVPSYLKTTPVCPSGGKYTLGAIGVTPTCSIPGHRLETATSSSAPAPTPKPTPIPPPSPGPHPRRLGPPVPAPSPSGGVSGGNGGKGGKGKGVGKGGGKKKGGKGRKVGRHGKNRKKNKGGRKNGNNRKQKGKNGGAGGGGFWHRLLPRWF